MHQNWKNWAHVTKLDPDRHLTQDAVEGVATSGTDAVLLSGTLNVTPENLADLREQVEGYGIPLVVEPADPSGAVFEGVDMLFVPSVLNTPDARWVVGKHQQWALQSPDIPWDRVVPEAYVVLNPASSVGKVTKAVCDLTPAEVAAYARTAEHYFHFPVVYIEYSGTYGDPAVVKAASEAIDTAVLYYGGGIDSAEKAAEMGRYADTIVVGNAVYEKGLDALRATVRAVQ
ncbi:phosphoglycerol geranylgeranyltransferase [Methanofollis ethanolicus]|uniref:phosphoglycerol geranylgeranyltransferase n=1 Tax=Methanofollis ethanolicus TaxID=488124 RepID=UPI000834B48F|nr:phosphoglycerol geranylgeranyltransferase [Methanofollis ethanolicus]